MTSELYSINPPMTAPSRLEAKARSTFGVCLYERAKMKAAKKMGEAISIMETRRRTISPVRNNMWMGNTKLIITAAANSP